MPDEQANVLNLRISNFHNSENRAHITNATETDSKRTKVTISRDEKMKNDCSEVSDKHISAGKFSARSWKD